MNKTIISLALGATALFATAAGAAPLSSGLTLAPDANVENVRLVCDEYGRCFRQRGRRVIIQDSYNYAPRERYIERRGYYNDRPYNDRPYNDGPRFGVGVGPGGVGVGIGVGPSW